MRSFLLSGAALAALSGPAHAFQASTEAAAPRRDDVIVVIGLSGNPGDVPGSAEVLTAADLDVQDYTDITRALRAVPGVNIQEEDGYGLRPNIGLRGTGVDRSASITLMEDGILIAPAPYAAPEAYYFPHTGRMAGIEIIKGAAGVPYGPRTQGGSVNLLSTPVPDAFGGSVDVWVGDEETRRIHAVAGGMIDLSPSVRFGGMAEIFTDSAVGFKDIDGPSAGDSGFEIEDYVGKLRLEIDGGAIDHSFELRGQYSDELSNETYLGLTQADFAADPFRRYAASQMDQMDAEHSLWSLTYNARFAGGTRLALVGYRSDFARDWFKLDSVDPDGAGPQGSVSISSLLDNPGGNATAFQIIQGGAGFVSADDALTVKHNNREYYAQGLQGELSGEMTVGSTDHRWRIGARVHHDEMDRYQWVERFRMDNGTMVQTSATLPGSDSNRIDSADAVAIYVQDEIVFGDWTFVPGVRFETVDLHRENWGGDLARTGAPTRTENSVDAIIPGLGIRYDVNDRLSVFGGVHRGFAPPAPGSTTQEPEDAVNFEFGSRYENGFWSVEAVGFHNAYSNLLGACTNSTGGGCTIGAQFDGGEVDVTGLEFAAEADLGEPLNAGFSIPVRVAWTHTNAEFQTAFNSSYGPWGNVQVGDALPYIPENQLYAAIGIDTDRFGGQLAVSWVGESRDSAGQGTIAATDLIESHAVADLSAWYGITEQVRARISVRNLTDEIYTVARRPAGLRPGAPRAVLFGISAEF